MSHYGSGIEYGLHCLLHLVGRAADDAPSSRDVAEFQGVSPSYVAKLFTQLEKAGLVAAAEGIRGGFRLARPADTITVLDVIDALEGDKPLFRCREVRRNCVLYGDKPPAHATRGVCGIHAIMLDAEQRMRAALAEHTLADIDNGVAEIFPAAFLRDSRDWFDDRRANRRPQQKEPKP